MKQYSINTGGHLITLDMPKVMGIINVTPDSFFEGSRKQAKIEIVKTAAQMLYNGASFLDIGGMSTRPGSEEITTEEELNRVIPAIRDILKEHPKAHISIDTYRSQVAQAAIDAGAQIINDISGGKIDTEILAVAARSKTPYICMHMQGTPQNMQDNPSYENVIQDVFNSLQKKIVRCRDTGIKDVIVDMGFGFGKTTEHNFKLLSNLDFFQHLDCPILAGISRKGMIYKSLNINPKESLSGTITANTIALQNGANILRVHDVKEAVECIKIWELTSQE